jgi:hypothetical protein
MTIELMEIPNLKHQISANSKFYTNPKSETDSKNLILKRTMLKTLRGSSDEDTNNFGSNDHFGGGNPDSSRMGD